MLGPSSILNAYPRRLRTQNMDIVGARYIYLEGRTGLVILILGNENDI